MACRKEILEALKEAFERWQSDRRVGGYTTGFGDRHTPSEETATMGDFEGAASEFGSEVTSKLGPAYLVRIARSSSGADHNEWSILIERFGDSRPSLNFHMRIK